MKMWFVTFCCLAAFAPTAWTIDPWTGPTRQAPHRGMTRAEVAAYYGEPYRRAAAGSDERWYYKLKYSEVYGRAMVPFEIDSDNVTLGSMTFGADGKVQRFDWKHTIAR